MEFLQLTPEQEKLLTAAVKETTKLSKQQDRIFQSLLRKLRIRNDSHEAELIWDVLFNGDL